MIASPMLSVLYIFCQQNLIVFFESPVAYTSNIIQLQYIAPSLQLFEKLLFSSMSFSLILFLRIFRKCYFEHSLKIKT